MLRPALRSRPLTYVLSLLILFVAFPAVRGAAGQASRVIPPTGKWVTDQAGFLSAGEERALSQKLAAYADTTSTQIVVVMLPSLQGAAASDYAVELGRSWGVGQAGYNNGVVILVSRDDRQMFIATGYGLEGAIPDAVASRVYRNILVPSFREGRFYDGLSQAADALIAAARGEFTASNRASDDSEGLDLALIIVLIILIVFIVTAIRQAPDDGDDGFTSTRKRRRGAEPPIIIWGGPGLGRPRGGGGFGGGGFGGFGGFGGGGGSFGGGGAGGGW